MSETRAFEVYHSVDIEDDSDAVVFLWAPCGCVKELSPFAARFLAGRLRENAAAAEDHVARRSAYLREVEVLMARYGLE